MTLVNPLAAIFAAPPTPGVLAVFGERGMTGLLEFAVNAAGHVPRQDEIRRAYRKG